MRALLISDDYLINNVISTNLSKKEYDVLVETDFDKGFEKMKELDWNCVIVDCPTCDIREKVETSAPVIYLCGSSENGCMGGEKGINRDYICKPFSFGALYEKVKSLIRRNEYALNFTEITVEDLTVDILHKKVTRAGKEIILQPLEFKILSLLVKNKNRVVTKKRILETIWEYDFEPNTNIVQTRVCHLRRKVDQDFPTKLIQTIHGKGYLIGHYDPTDA